MLRLEKSDKTPVTPLDPRISAAVFSNRRMRTARIAKCVDPENIFRTLELSCYSRSQRQQGDIALILGSPLDAIERYTASIEDSKRENDVTWTCAAQEGIACANLVRLRLRAPGVTLHEISDGDELSWLNEVTSI